ncbi:YgaC family protein [Nonomuraea sp. C10]|uniref:YgaC family protein n=1 Tax=Nonomuraea sp. C10 TaxID=2600577 RepID=UPI0021C3F72D|nr:YgaC family protein [Nonomuraea sp. C10]
MGDIEIVYRKYGGALHWHHPGTLLGEDEHGSWVAVPSGTVARKGEGPKVTWPHDSLMLFPRSSWWTATFNSPPHRIEVYVDVTTVPEWRDGQVTMLDLDLDVVRMRDGRLFLDDEDEFAEHQLTLGYPSEIIRQAEDTAHWLLQAVAHHHGPFGGAHTRWQAAEFPTHPDTPPPHPPRQAP